MSRAGQQFIDAARALEAEADERGGPSDYEQGLIGRLQDIGRHYGGGKAVLPDSSQEQHQFFAGSSGSMGTARPLSAGEVFTTSPGFKSIASGEAGERWSTGLIEVSPSPHMQFKGTFGESASTSIGPAIGAGALTSVPQVVPGVVEKILLPLTIEQLLLGAVTTSPTVRYVIEGTATSGAAGVAEGTPKPESLLGLVTTDEPIKKIATLLPISEEIIEDAPAVQAFVNGRLVLFCQVEAERQLFRGVAGGAEVQGLLTSRGVPVYNGGTADDRATQLFKAMNSMRGSALVEPDWIVMHPTDYQILRLRTDSAGQFLGGGPFLGPYGGPQGPAAAGAVSGVVDQLWGKPVYVTAAMGGPGTALVGTVANACVHSRGGMRVEASNSHDQFFKLNLIAIRAERRLGLTVYRSGGYVECRFAVGPGG